MKLKTVHLQIFALMLCAFFMITGHQAVKGLSILKESEYDPKGKSDIANLKDLVSEFRDVVCFQFSPQGDLLKSYTSALRDKNEFNKLTTTEHAFISKESNTYWTVFEVAGSKKSGATARMLY